MIYIGGAPFSIDSPSSSQGDILAALMAHPILVSASSSFKVIQEEYSLSERSGWENSTQSKCVYVFQREYATVDPTLVDLVGTDEATTCVGLVIRNHKSGMTSVAHMDSPKVINIGLDQMLSSLVVGHDFEAEFDVHLVGGFKDSSLQNNGVPMSESREGYSLPLCTKIVETLQKRGEKFHIQTLHVLEHNTRWDPDGNAYPIFNGFLVETSTGSIIPTNFDKTARCPDEIVRRIRISASFEDPNWKGRLLETYDTRTDRFVIAPCTWTFRFVQIASSLLPLSDSDLLLTCSTSPFAEGPDFVDNERRMFEYLIKHPDWRETFPKKQPRVFERTSVGDWTRG